MVLAYFSSLAGIASLNVAITELVNSKFGIKISWLKQLISWVLPLIVSIVGLLFGYGIFADFGTISDPMAWLNTILVGFATGLVSNGIYDIKYVQDLIDFIKSIKINK